MLKLYSKLNASIVDCVIISVSFSLFSSLISEEDTERREREKRRKEQLERRAPGDTQGDQARVESLGCEQARIEAGREVMRRGPGAGAGLFVPECDLSGHYEPVQCYRCLKWSLT